MSDRPRFVLDTNVLVDALCFVRSFGRRAFDAIRTRGDIVYSIPTLAELVDVIYRPRLQRYIREEERRRFLVLFRQQAILIEPKVEIRVCRDPKDDKFLELAVAASAEAILTRDRALLDLDPFRGIRLMEPQAFVGHAGDDPGPSRDYT
jgi:putative PIN family toxin of toxin-antitoxin system